MAITGTKDPIESQRSTPVGQRVIEGMTRCDLPSSKYSLLGFWVIDGDRGYMNVERKSGCVGV